MIRHMHLATATFTRSRVLKLLINKGEILLAGNAKLRIYGTLQCRSGKGMKMENRVFFKSAQEACDMGYRPCGHCMREAYLKWKMAGDAGDTTTR